MTDDKTKDWQKVRDEVSQDEAPQPQEEVLEDLIETSEQPDSGSHSLAHPSYGELEEKLTLAEQQAHENWEKSVRAMAELDNVRRRAEREVTNAHRYSLEKFIDALLPVIDSLEQALQLADEPGNGSMREGLELTLKLFLDVLQKFNVESLNPEGANFDPQLHEAMSIQESSDVAPNTVMTVFQKGYRLHDRVIRPARVIVSKKPAE